MKEPNRFSRQLILVVREVKYRGLPLNKVKLFIQLTNLDSKQKILVNVRLINDVHVLTLGGLELGSKIYSGDGFITVEETYEEIKVLIQRVLISPNTIISIER